VSLPRTSPFTERRRYTPLIPIKWSQRCTRARSIRYSGHYAPDLSLSNRLSNGVRSCEVGSHSTFRLHIRTIIGVIIDFSISFLFLETLPDLPPFIVSPDRCRHSHVYFGLLIFSNTGPTFFSAHHTNGRFWATMFFLRDRSPPLARGSYPRDSL